ncbi:ABC transporter permease [Paenibacillus chartarius]|uniref:ABC transporter permease n=1 Tax=Paenibacillus chartarius TaxID=747481 RepID=A0ABV6DU07_9BACL
MSLSKPEVTAGRTAGQLWRRRFTSFVQESLTYWRDVARGGFVLVLVAAVIGGAYEYGSVLRRLPDDFPDLWVVMLILAPALTFGGVRTLLKPADRVFLVPMEGRLGPYFRGAFRYSFIVQAGKTLAALTLIWPLYVHFHPGVQPLAGALATALAVKAGHLYADWQEMRLVSLRRRTALVWFRLAAAAVCVWAWFRYGLGWGWLSVGITVMLWAFLLYNSRLFTVGWDRLLQREAAQRKRLYRWFRWFTDVPQLPGPVRRRSWLGLLSRRLAVRREHTFTFLYEKTLLRTELFGMYARLLLVGLLLVGFVSELWLKSLFLAAVPLLGLVQLSALGDAHRYTFWLELYPVERRLQTSAVLGLVAPLAVLQAALQSIVYALTAPHGVWSALMPLLTLGAVLLGLRFKLRPSLQRKFERSGGADG